MRKSIFTRRQPINMNPTGPELEDYRANCERLYMDSIVRKFDNAITLNDLAWLKGTCISWERSK